MGWYEWRESETRGVLVAGRKCDVSDLNRGKVIELCEAVDKIAERTGTKLVSIPADIDLTDETTDDDSPAYCSCFIGVLVGECGPYEPEAVSREAMLRGLEQARAVGPEVWAEVEAAFRALGGKYPLDEEVQLLLGCVGPLPMAYLAYGVLGAEGEDEKGTFVRGQDMEQQPHETGVYGIQIDACSYDGSPAEPIDVSDEAHAAREREAPNGAYYLIARYD